MTTLNGPRVPSPEEVAAGLDLSRPVMDGTFNDPVLRDIVDSSARVEQMNRAEENQRRHDAFYSGAGRWQSEIGQAILQETPTAAVARAITRPSFQADETFSNDQFLAKLKVAQETLPEESLWTLRGAVSAEHFDHLYAMAKAEHDRRQVLAQAGWGPTLENIGVNLFDPASWAVGLAIGVPAFSAARTLQLGTKGWLASQAAAGGLAGVSLEALKAASGNAVTGSDYLQAAGWGMGLGALFAGFARNPGNAAEAAVFYKAGQELFAIGKVAKDAAKPFAAEQWSKLATQAGAKRAAQEGAAIVPEMTPPREIPTIPAPEPTPVPIQAADPQMSNGSAAREPSAFKQRAAAFIESQNLPPEVASVAKTIVQQMDDTITPPVAPEPTTQQAVRPAEVTELPSSPADLRNGRFLGRYGSPDGNEYTILAQTSDLSGPYVLRGPQGVIARDLDSIAAAKAAIPTQGTAADPAQIAAQIAAAQYAPPSRPSPVPKIGIELEGNEVAGFRYKGFRYVLEESDKRNKLWKAYKGDTELGYMELAQLKDGRWKISMIEMDEGARGNGSVLGLLKIAENQAGGSRMPDGVLLPDGYKALAKQLPWVKEWYRQRPRTEGGSEAWLSPQMLRVERELAQQMLDSGPSPKVRQRYEKLIKGYDEALASLPPEALLPENLRMMHSLTPDPMMGAGNVSPAIRAQVESVLDRLLPNRVGRRVVDDMADLPSPLAAEGLYHDRLVWVAMNSSDPVKVAYHESVHAIRRTGVISRQDWKALTDWAKKIGARAKYQIDEKYTYVQTSLEAAGLPKADAKRYAEMIFDEEAVAHALADHFRGVRFGGVVDKIFDKITDVLRAIRDALGIRGFRTWKDVAEDIDAGAMSQRDALGDVDAFNFFDDAFNPALDLPAASHPMAPKTVPWLDQDGTWNTLKQEDVSRPAHPLGLPRLDIAGRSGKTENAGARLLFSKLFNDTVGRDKHAINPFSADIDQRHIFQTWVNDFNRHKIAAYNQWADDLKLSPVERWTKEDDFYTEVGHYIANDFPGKEYHPAIVKFGNASKEIYADALESMKNPLRRPFADPTVAQPVGRPIEGADLIEPNSNYMWRKLDHKRVLSAVEMFGENGVAFMVRRAIWKANPDWAPEILDAVSRGYVRSIHRRSAGMADEWAQAMGEGDLAKLRTLLLEDANLDPATADNIITQMTAKSKSKEGDMQHTKKRVLLDESHVEPGLPTRGEGAADLAFTDLLDRNIVNVMVPYLRRVSGRVALGRVRFSLPERATQPGQVAGETVLIDGITSNAEIDQLIAKSIKWGKDNLPDYTAELSDRDVKHLKWGFDRIRGYPIDAQKTDMAWWLRMFRKLNAMRLMGQVGISQFGETGTAMSHFGLKAVMQHMPHFKRIVTDRHGKRMLDDLSYEMEAMALGGGWNHGMRFNHLDEAGQIPFDVRPSSRADRFERAANIGEQAVYNASGMVHVQSLQELMFGAVAAQRFADMAERVAAGKALGRGDLRRMAQLGLDEPMMQRIFTQFAAKDAQGVPIVDFQEGAFFGKKIARLNVNRWPDREAAAAFEQSLFRWVSKVIQQGDHGSASLFMSEPIWQTVFQFRSFVFQAWQNQFLYGIHMGDFRTFTTFMWSTMWSAAVRAAQLQLISLGRSDREAYLEKKMTSWELAKAGFERSGWSSLMPMGIDTALYLGGQDTMFNARSSGQPSNLIWGNPTSSLYDSAAKGLGGLVDSAWDGRAPSQSTIRNLASTLPFQNILPFSMLLDTMIADLPVSEPKKTRN